MRDAHSLPLPSVLSFHFPYVLSQYSKEGGKDTCLFVKKSPEKSTESFYMSRQCTMNHQHDSTSDLYSKEAKLYSNPHHITVYNIPYLCLTTHHIFKEHFPQVFKLSRLSKERNVSMMKISICVNKNKYIYTESNS